MRRAGNSAGRGRDRANHNVTEAMMQIRERSRRARRTGSDGEDSCDHVQSTVRGVVTSAPSRRSSKRSSAGKVLVCKNKEQREILKNTQVVNAVEVEVIRVVRIRSDIASLTRQNAQSDSSLTTVSARDKETEDSSKSEAKYILERHAQTCKSHKSFSDG